MTATRLYRAWGLTIDSALECPDFVTAATGAARADTADALDTADTVDVTIRFGETPSTLGPDAVKLACAEAASDHFLLHVPGVARFLTSHGHHLIVQREEAACDDDLAALLVGSPIAALLAQRGLLVVHAAVVERGGRAVALAGPSGSGKSHLAAQLIDRGFTLVADEVCAVRLDRAGVPLVEPAFPALHVWASTAEAVGLDARRLRRVRPGLELLAYPAVERFRATPAVLSAVVVLGTPAASASAGAEESQTARPGAAAGKPARDVRGAGPRAVGPMGGLRLVPRAAGLAALLQLTWRTWFYVGRAARHRHFERCAAAAGHCAFVQPIDGRASGSRLADLVAGSRWP